MKPELLVPAGNAEAFNAALEGGADAIYMGLNRFNARSRAKNFSLKQLPGLIEAAHKKGTKVYTTFNTLVKNEELKQAIDFLYILSQTDIDAVIIQDLGIYNLIRENFPEMEIHTSTQMGIHNSTGADFAKKQNFERVILARELTLDEIRKISKRTNVDLETFIHGALCYSYSGYCLYSSFLGGRSGNRGACKQPCRRKYKFGNNENYLFSLKDLQLIDLLPEFEKMGISSLKIEGRMKSAGYVYNVTRAYRMALDDYTKIPEAKKILEKDLGREKTEYFMGNSVKKAITQKAFTGIHIGDVVKTDSESIVFSTNHILNKKDRLRIMPQSGVNSNSFRLKKISVEQRKGKFINVKNAGKNQLVQIKRKNDFQKGDKVFLTGFADRKFSSNIDFKKEHFKMHYPNSKKLLKSLRFNKKNSGEEIYLRINDLKWLNKIHTKEMENVILELSKNDLRKLDIYHPNLKKITEKLIIQLPLFIREDELKFYRGIYKKFAKLGLKQYMLNHISQKDILPDDPKIKYWASESLYAMNDFAIDYLKKENFHEIILPFENDMDNMIKGKYRESIVPLHFYPKLFFSRMPVDFKKNSIFADRDIPYFHKTIDGFTVVIPNMPVSVFQYKKKIRKQGFRKFLIDLSFERPDRKKFQMIMKKYKRGIHIHNCYNFNFKLGLW